jgi:NAD(P)-dependent dehydrogenase (short-subunit alcohol dehydrogenase family)
MEVTDKIIVVTGGASGIGRALCLRFAQEGAKTVAVVDVDEEGAKAVADEINGYAIKCDVRKEDEIIDVVRQTEEKIGPIDMFCSNAGIIIMGCNEVLDEDWQRIWQINVMAQIYAAKAVIPRMIERGGGYLLNMASAAGLLSQIGSAPYSVTKHAAVGLAENLAITYGDQGIKVFVVCPQAVRTAMTAMTDDDGGVAAVDGLMEPEQVADSVMEGLAEERFLILPHPEVQTYMERKVSDYDRWLNGMRRLQKRFLEGQALKE